MKFKRNEERSEKKYLLTSRWRTVPREAVAAAVAWFWHHKRRFVEFHDISFEFHRGNQSSYNKVLRLAPFIKLNLIFGLVWTERSEKKYLLTSRWLGVSWHYFIKRKFNINLWSQLFFLSVTRAWVGNLKQRLPITSKSSNSREQHMWWNCQNQLVSDITVHKFRECQTPLAPVLTQALATFLGHKEASILISTDGKSSRSSQ